MESTFAIINELAKDDAIMWVVGGGSVVSENNSKGMKDPKVSDGFITVEADNWHFHIGTAQVTGIQFVEAESHGDMPSFYVRFSNDNEETLLRGYFPNPYLDNDCQRTEFQPEKLQAFEAICNRYVGREGIVFVQRPIQSK